MDGRLNPVMERKLEGRHRQPAFAPGLVQRRHQGGDLASGLHVRFGPKADISGCANGVVVGP